MPGEVGPSLAEISVGATRPTTKEIPPAQIEQAKQLKDIFHRAEYFSMSMVGHRQVPSVIESMGQKLLENPVYAVDTPAGKEARVIRPREDLQRDGQILVSYIQQEIDLPDGITPQQLSEMIDSYLELLPENGIYTRPGVNGLLDILNDGFLISEIINRRVARNPALDIINELSAIPEKAQKRARALIQKGDNEQAALVIEQALPLEPKVAYQQKIWDASLNEGAYLGRRIAHLEESRRAFSLEEVNLSDPGALPLEVQYLIAKDPQLAGVIEQLQDKGLDLRLLRINRTSERVLRAIERVSISQENFINTWLPALIKDGVKPRLTLSAKAKERALGKGLSEEEGFDPESLSADIETILESAKGFLRFEVMNPDLRSDLDEQAVDRLNQNLDHLRKRYALGKMTWDNSDERTNEAQQIIKKMMYIGPVAHILESAGLGTIAKLFASSADDVMGEWAEIRALLGSGFSQKEVFKRLRIALPVFGFATYGAAQVEELLHEGRNAEAGALFGVTAVALSLTTAIQSISMYHEAFRELIRQGKTPERSQLPEALLQVIDNPQFQQSFREFEKTKALFDSSRRPELLDHIKGELKNAGQPEEVIEQFMQVMSGIDQEKLVAAIRTPSAKKQWIEAIKQDFSNPARLGIFLGASFAPVAGMAASMAGGLENGFVMAGVGSIESVMAGLTVLAAKRINEFKYQSGLRKEISVLQRPVKQVVPTVGAPGVISRITTSSESFES